MRNRSTIPVIAFTLAFTSCLAFAYAWFNTDIGRPSSVLRPPSSEQTGSTFVPEPISEEVKKILGTRNILNGTFLRQKKSSSVERRKSNDLSRRLLTHYLSSPDHGVADA